MVNERNEIKAGGAIGVSASHAEDGIVFVRRLASGCWASTADHRVFYIHRKHSRRMHQRGVRITDSHDSWSPDNGIA